MICINKKTIVGIALAAVLVGGMFAVLPQSASADLTTLDKFGTIINMLTKILTEVTETNEDLLLKKRFYQFVNDTEIEVESGKLVFAKVRVVSCTSELELMDACAFNVESILIESVQFVDVTGPTVDGIQSVYSVQGLTGVNFLVDAVKRVPDDDFDLFVGPPGFVGASEEVEVRIESSENVAFTIKKIEFNGQQPQGMELELVIEIASP